MPLHRELTFGDGASLDSLGVDLAAEQLAAGGGAPSRWVAEDSSEGESDEEQDGEQQLNGREHTADAELEDASLLPDGHRLNGHSHANGEHHSGVNGMSHEDGSDEETGDPLGNGSASSKPKQPGRLPRAASKGRLVQV